MWKAVVSHMERVERTDSGAVAQADAGPLTQLCASRYDLGGATGLDARIFGFERGLVFRSLAHENGNLVDCAGREAEQCGNLVACFLAARRATVGSGCLMSDRNRVGVTAREAAGAAVGTREDGSDFVDQWVTGDRELLAEEAQGNTNEQTEDGSDDCCFEDDLHRDLI
jgi:hypothetical protein